MPQYLITSPDGQKWKVTAPEGASQDDVLSYAQSQWKPQQEGVAPDAAAPPSRPSIGEQAIDVAKQLPTGAAVGVESLRNIVPSITGLIGRGAELGLEKLGLPAPAGALREAREFVETHRRPPLTDVLPKPTTTAGEYARTVGEFAPAAAAGPGGIARRALGQVVAPGLASEAAGQATKGTEYEPYARVGGAVAGGFPFGLWRTGQIKSAAPLADELYAAAGQQYQQVRDMGLQLRPAPIANVADGIADQLTKRGFSRDNVPETFNVIRALQNLRSAPAGATVTADNFDTARQQLLQATRNATNRREAAAAWHAIGELDDYLRGIPEAHVITGDAQLASQLFDEARRNWAAAKRVEMVGSKIELGELNAATAHSGTNLDNSLRQAVKQLIRPNKYGETLAERHGFNEREIAAMNEVSRGTRSIDLLRSIGNLLGGGGGYAQLATTGAGMFAGYETGHPELAGLSLLGMGARRAAGAMTARQAERLQELVARRAPAARDFPPGPPSEAELQARAAILRAGQGLSSEEFTKMLDRLHSPRNRVQSSFDALQYGGPQ